MDLMSKRKIRKLAQMAAANDIIPQDIERYVLEVLNKQELKVFLESYKSVLDKNRVYISTSTEISKSQVTNAFPQFRNKELILTTDETLGGGIKMRQDDTIIDFTFKKFIDDTIDKLKN